MIPRRTNRFGNDGQCPRPHVRIGDGARCGFGLIDDLHSAGMIPRRTNRFGNDGQRPRPRVGVGGGAHDCFRDFRGSGAVAKPSGCAGQLQIGCCSGGFGERGGKCVGAAGLSKGVPERGQFRWNAVVAVGQEVSVLCESVGAAQVGIVGFGDDLVSVTDFGERSGVAAGDVEHAVVSSIVKRQLRQPLQIGMVVAGGIVAGACFSGQAFGVSAEQVAGCVLRPSMIAVVVGPVVDAVPEGVCAPCWVQHLAGYGDEVLVSENVGVFCAGVGDVGLVLDDPAAV